MSTRAQELFTTIHSEGGLLPPSLLARVADLDDSVPGLQVTDYHLSAGQRFGEVISPAWARLTEAWTSYQEAIARLPADDTGATVTRDRWLLPLLAELGFGRLPAAKAIQIGTKTYPVSHGWGQVPIHLVGSRIELDRRTAGVRGAATATPHSMVQELLNRDDDRLWGIVSNGRRLRLLRDNLSLTRQAYVEFDLEAMMSGQIYSDFTVLWLTCHQSRFEADRPEHCLLERWTIDARTTGERALDHLRDGVEAAITALGTGFLRHRANRHLTDVLSSGELNAVEYYRELLRVIYRLIFCLVAEERGLLHPAEADPAAVQRYKAHYSIGRIRELAEKRRGGRHTDLWQQATIVFRALGGTGLEPLALPALGGVFSTDSTPHLNEAQIENRDFLEAMRALSGRHDQRQRYRARFDYRNLGVEELGSVYESLLELHPVIEDAGDRLRLTHEGSERRDTGSHYTPPSILKRVLNFGLEPKIEEALASHDPEQALLALRVLDPACGSGHFLIAAAHRIAGALASVRTGEEEPSPKQLTPALREVVARCIYGVDYNPMAVELCKVALWLEALEPGKPLSFLDHHIRCGNSLIGVPMGTTVARNRAAVDARRAELEQRERQLEPLANQRSDPQAAQEARAELTKVSRELRDCQYDSWADAIPDAAFKATTSDDPGARKRANHAARLNKKERREDQLQLGFGTTQLELPAQLVTTFAELGAGTDDTLAEVTIRAARYDDAIRTIEYQHALELADTWCAVWFWTYDEDDPMPPTQGVFLRLRDQAGSASPEIAERVQREANDRRFFHFELAYPEVFTSDRGGFDVVLGNPPYLGGMRITATYGPEILHFLKGNHPARTGGRVDLAAYFVRRGFDLLRDDGDLCFITTNTIAQGDTRNAALTPIVEEWNGEIANAVRSEPWPGDATVSVAVLHLHHGNWKGERTLDGEPVEAIGADLAAGDTFDPIPLTANEGIAFVGTNVLGEGFWIDATERERLLAEDERNAEVIKPFIGGRHAMSAADPSVTSRWVIDFEDRSLEEAERYHGPMRIVRQRVKPQRDATNERRTRENWWKHGRPASNLYTAIKAAGLHQVIAIPEVSKAILPVILPADAVYQHTLVLFASDSAALFSLLSSSFHWLWGTRLCTTMRNDLRYNPSQIFVPFPQPPLDQLQAIGERFIALRKQLHAARKEGLTSLYNAVADPDCDDSDITELRDMHVELDCAVARAYGWEDLTAAFEHGHHSTPRFGVRWTVKPDTQREIERRLLELNQQRAALQ